MAKNPPANAGDMGSIPGSERSPEEGNDNPPTVLYRHRCGSMVKNLPTNAGDTGDVGSILRSGRSPGGGNRNLFQYSCLGNHMDRRAWQATHHRV